MEMKKEIAKSYDITYINALEATKSCGFKIENESLTNGVITFKVGASIWSWGERFSVKLEKLNTNLTLVEVSSDNFQLGSWGKHDHNVKSFFSTLETLLRK
jgi:hypothetical protein